MDHVSRSSGILCAEVDGEMVALNVEKGVCYGLDAIGSRIWGMIEHPTPLRDICDALTARYRVDSPTCMADVVALISELRDEGLVVLSSSVAPPPSPPPSAGA